MDALKRSKIFLIALASLTLGTKCKDPGDIRVYSLDVDNSLMRHEEHPIAFGDDRLRCTDTPDGRECRYICIDANDLEEILPPGLE